MQDYLAGNNREKIVSDVEKRIRQYQHYLAIIRDRFGHWEAFAEFFTPGNFSDQVGEARGTVFSYDTYEDSRQRHAKAYSDGKRQYEIDYPLLSNWLKAYGW
ncbi:MAG: hypothetical protein ACPGOY_18815 [Rhodospirillaceae bacterium]